MSLFFLLRFESTGLSVQEKKRKTDFQDCGHCGQFGLPIETILAIFNLQVTSMLPTKFRVNWPGYRRSRLLKQIVDAERSTTDID